MGDDEGALRAIRSHPGDVCVGDGGCCQGLSNSRKIADRGPRGFEVGFLALLVLFVPGGQSRNPSCPPDLALAPIGEPTDPIVPARSSPQSPHLAVDQVSDRCCANTRAPIQGSKGRRGQTGMQGRRGGTSLHCIRFAVYSPCSATSTGNGRGKGQSRGRRRSSHSQCQCAVSCPDKARAGAVR